MFILVTTTFLDYENDNAKRLKGAFLKVTKARGEEIIKKGYAKEIKPLDLTKKSSKSKGKK